MERSDPAAKEREHRPLPVVGDLVDGVALDVSAVLWDADGVLQHSPGWHEHLAACGGERFIESVVAAEAAALTGEEPVRCSVQRALDEIGSDASADDVLGAWDLVEADPEALTLVRSVRSQGISCHLATNQQDRRIELMRHRLGYDELFDESFYSAELGVAKPDPRFFETILARIQVRPADVLFIDDNMANVEAARSVGLRAELHDPIAGADGLRRILASVGL